jgi:transposase InsO family protein
MSTLTQRSQVITLVGDVIAAGAHQDRACGAISLSDRTLQRWQRDQARGDQRPTRVQAPKNRLSATERQAILAVANCDEFAHLAPSQIVPRLADQGQSIASESRFNRMLNAASQLQHRGPERPRQHRSKPRALSASTPNQLFSWDSTYLPTLVTGIYFYPYLFLDIFSRKIVGWQVYGSESSELAGEVMRDICQRENIAPDQVKLHSDNGSPMKGAAMLATLQSLGVVPSFSRPAVSNDNPLSMGTKPFAQDSPKVKTCWPITWRPVVWSKWLDTPGIFLPERTLMVSSSTRAVASSGEAICCNALRATRRCRARQFQSSRFMASYSTSLPAAQNVRNESLANKLTEFDFNHTHIVRQYMTELTSTPERL